MQTLFGRYAKSKQSSPLNLDFPCGKCQERLDVLSSKVDLLAEELNCKLRASQNEKKTDPIAELIQQRIGNMEIVIQMMSKNIEKISRHSEVRNDSCRIYKKGTKKPLKNDRCPLEQVNQTARHGPSGLSLNVHKLRVALGKSITVSTTGFRTTFRRLLERQIIEIGCVHSPKLNKSVSLLIAAKGSKSSPKFAFAQRHNISTISVATFNRVFVGVASRKMMRPQ